MAKNRSIVDISGSVSGLTFYTLDGKRYVKNKSSLSREKVMKDPAFARSREQMSEFGGAAALGKTVRSVWRTFKKRAADSRIAGRLNAQLLRTLKTAPGLRGQRSFILRDHANLLTGFRLKKDIYVGSIMDLPAFSVSPDRRHMEISFPASAKPRPPKGATHYRIIAAMGLLSDFIYDTGEKSYVPAHPANHGTSVHIQSTEFQIKSANIPQLALELPPGVQPGPQDTLLAVWGIEFLQEVNGAYETLFENSAMEIGRVG